MTFNIPCKPITYAPIFDETMTHIIIDNRYCTPIKPGMIPNTTKSIRFNSYPHDITPAIFPVIGESVDKSNYLIICENYILMITMEVEAD